MDSKTYIKEALETLKITEDIVNNVGFLGGVEALKLIAWTKDIIVNHINDFSDSNEIYINGLTNNEFQELLYAMCKVKYQDMYNVCFKIDGFDKQTYMDITYKNKIKY